MNLWVVGASPGSLGDRVVEMATGYDRVLSTHRDTLDVGDWDAIDAWVQEQGPIEHTVFAVGVAALGWIKETERWQYNHIFNTNIGGFIGVIRALTRHQDGGRVLVVVSDASHVAMRGSLLYCASKAALHQAVRVTARELAPAWQVNGLSPTVIDGTNMSDELDVLVPAFRQWSKEKMLEYERSSIPMGRRAGKEEVASVALDILQMPDFMTGSIVTLTGGK